MSLYRLKMDLPKMLLLLVVAVRSLRAEPAGYHYDRPSSGPSPPSIYTGHHFAPLSTVQPLPPVPALPSLPTGHGFQQRIPTQPTGSILSRYMPGTPAAPIGYPASASPQTSITYHGQQPIRLKAPSQLQQPINVPSAPGQAQLPFNVPSAPAAPQPLRVPFGKTALFSPGESYVDATGRQLKQYAVIELIDNDISESPAPFLKSTFFDRYRAHLGASGIGATAFGPATGSGSASGAGSGRQLDSRANALVLEQQALSLQPRQLNQGQRQESVALGSGGLGYIRLPNGNVYLGSGSLGYISGQQRIASVRDARTRSELTSDALHFGHGALGGAGNFLRFK